MPPDSVPPKADEPQADQPQLQGAINPAQAKKESPRTHADEVRKDQIHAMPFNEFGPKLIAIVKANGSTYYPTQRPPDYQRLTAEFRAAEKTCNSANEKLPAARRRRNVSAGISLVVLAILALLVLKQNICSLQTAFFLAPIPIMFPASYHIRCGWLERTIARSRKVMDTLTASTDR